MSTEDMQAAIFFGITLAVCAPIFLWILSDMMAQKRHERALELARAHNRQPNLWAHLMLTVRQPNRKDRR
jgi:hypothetical protein